MLRPEEMRLYDRIEIAEPMCRKSTIDVYPPRRTLDRSESPEPRLKKSTMESLAPISIAPLTLHVLPIRIAFRIESEEPSDMKSRIDILPERRAKLRSESDEPKFAYCNTLAEKSDPTAS
jgi:hypothetical protein